MQTYKSCTIKWKDSEEIREGYIIAIGEPDDESLDDERIFFTVPDEEYFDILKNKYNGEEFIVLECEDYDYEPED